MGQVQNEEHLCLIAVIGVERPNKATVERELEERDGMETQEVNTETTERVDVLRRRRVRTSLSLSV